MKTYVINMEKDVSKRKIITHQLIHHHELDWQIWKAVDGGTLSQDEQTIMISPIFFEKYKTNATLPAAGCSLSHYHIYKDICKKNIPFALILEDDAILSDNLQIETLQAYLDTNEPVAVLLSPGFWYWDEDNAGSIGDKHTIYRVYDAFMTSGYLINLAAANMLAEIVYPVKFMADAWRDFVNKGLKLYGVVPHLTSYPKGLGEIGRSRLRRSLYVRLRLPFVKLYLALLRCDRLLKGEHRSKRKW